MEKSICPFNILFLMCFRRQMHFSVLIKTPSSAAPEPMKRGQVLELLWIDGRRRRRGAADAQWLPATTCCVQIKSLPMTSCVLLPLRKLHKERRGSSMRFWWKTGALWLGKCETGWALATQEIKVWRCQGNTPASPRGRLFTC